MKRKENYYLIVIFINLLMILSFVCSASAYYSKKKLATHLPGYGDANLNNQGHAVWSYQVPGSGDSEIYLYNGTEVIQITDNDYDDNFPDINDSGVISWSGDGEVFTYDGTTTDQITEGSGSSQKKTQISNNGHIAWESNEGDDTEIFYYNGTEVIQLTDNDYDDHTLRLSENGSAAWLGKMDPDGFRSTEVLYYDGTTIEQLTNDDRLPIYLEIGANGHVVWSQSTIDQDKEIVLYDGSHIITVATGVFGRAYTVIPDVNAYGHVVWDGYHSETGNYEIFLYDGTATTIISDSPGANNYPKINDNGQVVWFGSGSAYVVYLFNGESIEFVHGMPPSAFRTLPQIGNLGHLIYTQANLLEFEIIHASPSSSWGAAHTVEIGQEKMSTLHILNYCLLLIIPSVFVLSRRWARQA